MAMKYLKLLCTKDKHPHFHNVMEKAKIMKDSNLLRMHYIEPPPKNLFYDIVTKAQTMKLKYLIPLVTVVTSIVIIILSALYVGSDCGNDVTFDQQMMRTFAEIVGAGSFENIKPTTICRTLYATSALLNVIFKSIALAIMVAKFESVSPKLFFTPSLVINFRDGIPILQFRVMNAQGTLLDVENLTAQWAKPTKSKEGEIYGKLFDVKLTAFQCIKSPISISHIIDKDSPFANQNLKRMKGSLFVSIVVWDPIVQRAVRAMTHYNLGKDVGYNMRFDDITVKSSAAARKDGTNPISDATRFNETIPLKIPKKKSEKSFKPGPSFNSNNNNNATKDYVNSDEIRRTDTFYPSESGSQQRPSFYKNIQSMSTLGNGKNDDNNNNNYKNQQYHSNNDNVQNYRVPHMYQQQQHQQKEYFQSSKEELAYRQERSGNSKYVVKEDIAMSQQQKYNNDIDKAYLENNNTITKKQYQPETIREETIVEITEANDIVVPSPPKMQSGFTKRNNNKVKERIVKKKLQPKRNKRLREKRRRKRKVITKKKVVKQVNKLKILKHKEITTYENVIAGNLPPGTVVLVAGGTQIETGEYIRMCPYCCALEFAMIEAEIPYQIIRTDMFCGDNKPEWFKKVHPESKPAVPCLYSDGKWIFDTINIINELKRLQKDTLNDKILSYTDGYDKFSAMTVAKYAGSEDNSEEEKTTRANLMALLQPYIDRLKTNKYLGGDSLSYSDCFFSQQMCSIGVFVKVLKGTDMMESVPELSSYLKRLKMRDSWKFVRVSKILFP